MITVAKMSHDENVVLLHYPPMSETDCEVRAFGTETAILQQLPTAPPPLFLGQASTLPVRGAVLWKMRNGAGARGVVTHLPRMV